VPVPSAALRETLLAAQVLDDIDLELHADGVTLVDGTPIPIRWSSILAATGGAPLGSNRARHRIVAWLRLRRRIADFPADLLFEQSRALGLPTGHALYPGRGWVRTQVLGDALVLGLGVLGLDPAKPDDVEVVPASIWRSAHINPALLWEACHPHLERMGGLAAVRWRRDGENVLRPMGGCDVVTLLGSRSLRAALVRDAGGMRPVVAPMRTRGWTSLSRLDPAFGPAAAEATDHHDRGFRRPVLVTADEVVLALDGPHTALGALDGVA
jgi:hypothetical protein